MNSDLSSTPEPTGSRQSLTDLQRFQAFVESVSDYAIYTLSAQGIVTSWNAGARRFKGYSAEEIIGRHFSVFYTPEDRADGKPARALDIALREGKFEEEGWRQRKDGNLFWASVVIDPIRDDSGELIGFAKVTRDVTERRDAAEALQRAKEALFQAQKLEAVGKLTGGIAHDFNNLLGVIISGLDLFAQKSMTASEEKVLESMQRAASRAATLTQQLLTFARRQPLRRDRYNVNRIILSFEAVLRRAASSVEFDLRLAPRLPRVLIDSTQFEAALLNLVTNARDAMPSSGRIVVRTEEVSLEQNQIGTLPAGRYVLVTVRDTGEGMSAEVAQRAFEPFYTTKPVGKGTGMGLSQVYGLIQQSDGDVRIESEVGVGTSVCMYLPAVGEAEGPDDDAGSSGSKKEKALLVDDQPDVLGVAVELFRHMGYEVLSASNGEDALEILKRSSDIDVLFTDVVMPGINGIELSREAVKLKPGIKVVLVSGYAAPAFEKGPVEIDQFQFLSKPYRLPEIMKILRTAN